MTQPQQRKNNFLFRKPGQQTNNNNAKNTLLRPKPVKIPTTERSDENSSHTNSLQAAHPVFITQTEPETQLNFISSKIEWGESTKNNQKIEQERRNGPRFVIYRPAPWNHAENKSETKPAIDELSTNGETVDVSVNDSGGYYGSPAKDEVFNRDLSKKTNDEFIQELYQHTNTSSNGTQNATNSARDTNQKMNDLNDHTKANKSYAAALQKSDSFEPNKTTNSRSKKQKSKVQNQLHQHQVKNNSFSQNYENNYQLPDFGQGFRENSNRDSNNTHFNNFRDLSHQDFSIRQFRESKAGSNDRYLNNTRLSKGNNKGTYQSDQGARSSANSMIPDSIHEKALQSQSNFLLEQESKQRNKEKDSSTSDSNMNDEQILNVASMRQSPLKKDTQNRNENNQIRDDHYPKKGSQVDSQPNFVSELQQKKELPQEKTLSKIDNFESKNTNKSNTPKVIIQKNDDLDRNRGQMNPVHFQQIRDKSKNDIEEIYDNDFVDEDINGPEEIDDGVEVSYYDDVDNITDRDIGSRPQPYRYRRKAQPSNDQTATSTANKPILEKNASKPTNNFIDEKKNVKHFADNSKHLDYSQRQYPSRNDHNDSNGQSTNTKSYRPTSRPHDSVYRLKQTTQTNV